jgi:hypothetical protein
MSYSKIPHNDFQAGFEAGFRAIRGTSAATPTTPGQPPTPGNMTPFLLGVRKGLERAGMDLDQHS